MKKVLSVILALVMVLTLATPAFAAWRGNSEYPIIFIRGNDGNIVDEEGNVVYDFNYDTSRLASDVAEVCLPLFLTGITTGDYSVYYDELYKKLAEIYGNAKCDENGDPLAGTTHGRIGENVENAKVEKRTSYGMHDCHYIYDWRLDPWEMAEKLNDFIEEVKANSGKDKVCLYGRCMGTTPILAYLARYGYESVDTVCLNSTVTNGCELIGDVFTGNLCLDTDAILRFANGYHSDEAVETFGDVFIFNFIMATVRLLNSLGLTKDAINVFMKTAFKTLGKGVTSCFVRAAYGTWPSYWTMVKSEEIETAKNVVFGEEGSELRQTYAGLIEKIDRTTENITTKIPTILQTAKENGVKVCIIAKYGSQMFPYVNSYNELSDQWISIGRSTIGATACKINETLPQSYIDQQEAAGLGKYISYDKQVDTSTCALPDNTWVIKGLNHEQWIQASEELAYAVCGGVVTSVDSDAAYPQFLCYDKGSDSIIPMTEENMNCEDYSGTETGSKDSDKTLRARLSMLIEVVARWIKIILNALGIKGVNK